MTFKSLHYKSNKCVGCRLCEIACSLTNAQVINPERARIRINRDHKNQVDNAIYCHQCKNAPCIEACEYEALSRDPNTNAIIVEKDNCVACENCVQACPYSTPKLDPSRKFIFICDLCGGSPECVEICPENAILYIENETKEGEDSN